ncbi:hypothetical protein DPEC_G00161950 [Dallia pectoralis]|uniref:Uncharacterized protein n=1 Tax=Dallia pectoralis TaxID=75939 RepID=A0ACC2GGP3_DALPE|nr:hypothetical protein DPEC_G00161950 [Dallia pectoralis]
MSNDETGSCQNFTQVLHHRRGVTEVSMEGQGGDQLEGDISQFAHSLQDGGRGSSVSWEPGRWKYAVNPPRAQLLVDTTAAFSWFSRVDHHQAAAGKLQEGSLAVIYIGPGVNGLLKTLAWTHRGCAVEKTVCVFEWAHVFIQKMSAKIKQLQESEERRGI